MGSQTLEIFRQGIWASFTGGWFFDPHQEIFCNTFHMYLWLCLLLGPFVLHLTVDSSFIPTILYPLVIFIIFAIIKLINHKLHILFDGEELLEDDKIKDDASPEDDKNEKTDEMKISLGETTQNEALQGEQNKTPVKLSNSSSTSFKDIDSSLKKEVDNFSSESITCSTPEIPDNSQHSNTNLVTTSPMCSPVERAVVVDLHCTKLGFVGGEMKEKETATKETSVKETNGGATKSSPMYSLNEIIAEDNNLIIANKPTVVSEFDDEESDVLDINTDKKTVGSLQNETHGSTDSSWGSSSDCSTLSEMSVEAGMDPKVKFVTNGHSDDSKTKETKGASGGKSESNLAARLTNMKKIVKIETGDKAVSLPALEMEKEDKKQNAARSINHVGFSLPEIEKPSTSASSSPCSQNENEKKLNENSKSDPEKIMSIKDNDENRDIGVLNSQQQTLSELFDAALPDKASSLAQRNLIRQGAFREGGSSRYSLLNRRQRTNSGSPATSLLNQDNDGGAAAAGSSSDPKHYAFTHEDTSAGAVHCFQDEYGQWFTYTFGDDSAQPIAQPFMIESLQNMLPAAPARNRDSNASSLLSQLENDPLRMQVEFNDFALTSYLRALNLYPGPNFSGGNSSAKAEEPAPKKYYMLPIMKDYSVKVSFDRLALLSLLDRNKNSFQAFLSVLLATLVAYLGYELLSREYFYDFWLFVICFIIAKCQFSLLKSVQPDSASPIHGHNSIIVFSRSVYFCITAMLILIIDEGIKLGNKSVSLYGIQLHSETTLIYAREILLGFLLAFPLIFLFGILPQINTFVMNCLEQFDIHIFGGTAMTSLLSSIYAFSRAIMFTLVLAPLCYLPLEITENGKSRGQHVLYSVFSGVLLSLSYHISRSTSSPDILWKVFQKYCCCCKPDEMSRKDAVSDFDDPLPDKLIQTVKTRVVHDSITCVIIAFLVFAVHVSTAFSSLQPTLSYLLYILTGIVGIVTHYLLPQLRKQLPWLFVSSPVLKSHEYKLYEWQEHSKIMWFERAYVWSMFVEKNVLYPLVCLSAITQSADEIADKFGNTMGAVLITVCSMKLLRSSFTNSPRQHITLIWTVLFFNYDYKGCSETFLIDYFFMSIFVDKVMELYLKFKFILTYTAPWQITWGSAFHAFAQPVSVPHCGMLMVQAIVSAFFSAPLNPLLGSAIFITSYMRPIKFWEKDYNTKRVDHSNTRLSSHIDSNPGADDNNLNSIFYEHLTRSLQHSLCGDLALGRWGNYSSGDCFIMASDYLNALVHIIEIGNGYVTFQLRGLEFRGTYCQQREVEAINENVDDDEGCCCCQPGHVANLLSFNAAFSQRWLAWEVVQSKYILEGYSVSDNTAITMFQMFDLRKIFITYYVTSIVFYCVRNKRLATWLSDESLMNQIEELRSSTFVDVDGVFRPVTDKDYDLAKGGVTRQSFCQNYHEWLVCCNQHRPENEQIEDDGVDSNLVTLCFALSLLGRRLLSTASNNQWNAALKSFLHGLHALFKGDFRVTAAKDEWVLADADLALLRKVVAPAVRMALKLHQDHFTCVDEFEDNNVMYETISSHEEQFVICHEGHPSWRQAVLHNRSNLLALRYVTDDGTDDYKIIMLNKRCLNFRVIKVNKECVRGLWAGQLQELIFLRNRNPERGSIQNAKQALRNMINSSCDQPIGYPIYVSPLTTSYSETDPFYNQITIGNLNGKNIRNFFRSCYMSIYNQFAGHFRDNSGPVEIEMSVYIPGEQNVNKSGAPGSTKGQITSRNNRAGSYASIPSSSNHSTSTSSSHGESSEIAIFPYFTEGKAIILDADRVTEALDCDLSTNLTWPSHINMLRDRMNTSGWYDWLPLEGMIGDIIHVWKPDQKDKNRRSHLKKSVYLLRINDHTIPILEDGIKVLSERTEQLTAVPLA